MISAAAATNKWIADLEPWKMKADELKPKAAGVIRITLEAVFVLAHLLGPFIPRASEAIIVEKLNQTAVGFGELKPLGQNLKEGAVVESNSVLFLPFSAEQLEIDTPVMKPKSADPTPPPPVNLVALDNIGNNNKGGNKDQNKGKGKQQDGQQQNGEKKKKEKKPAAPPAPALDMDQPLFSRLDLRVGEIVEVENHPDAERLYVEKIDVGEEKPRTIISGILILMISILISPCMLIFIWIIFIFIFFLRGWKQDPARPLR